MEGSAWIGDICEFNDDLEAPPTNLIDNFRIVDLTVVYIFEHFSVDLLHTIAELEV